MAENKPLVVNGWPIFTHPLILDKYESLAAKVETLKAKDPSNYKKKSTTKRLAAIHKLAFEIIPKDPTIPEYRQGTTLGENHKHWFIAKFFQQYHLFFRFHSESKIIVLAWVNDEKTKRAYDGKSDAYRAFEKTLNNGNPPDDWSELIAEAKGLRP